MSKIKLIQWEQRTVSDLMAIEIDTELLTKCEPAFEGKTLEELKDFLYELDVDEFVDDNEEVLGEFGQNLYEFMNFCNPITEYYDSSNKSSDRTIVSGDEDLGAYEYFLKQQK